MNELKGLSLALFRQRRRLQELVEISGKLDPDHPLQQFSIRRIEWLEKEIEKIKQKT